MAAVGRVVVFAVLVLAPLVAPTTDDESRSVLVKAQCKEQCNEQGIECASACYQQAVIVEQSKTAPISVQLLCREETALVLTWTPLSRPHIAYLLEVRTRDADHWISRNMTHRSVEAVRQLKPGHEYQVRVQAVTADGQVEETSAWWTTLEDKFQPGQLENVTITQRALPGGELRALVSWAPAADRTCFYELEVMSYFPQPKFDQVIVRIPEVDVSFSHDLASLEYDTDYTVQVRGKNRNGSKESADLFAHFTTPSCLQATAGDVNVCSPARPAGLHVTEAEVEVVGDMALFNFTASWDAPEVSPQYYVALLTVGDNETHTHGVNVTVPGNSTSVSFPPAPVAANSTYYSVLLSAHSPAGVSPDAYKYRGITPVAAPDAPHISTSWQPSATTGYHVIVVTATTVVVIAVVVAGVAVLAYHRQVKRRRFENRCRYFESLDEKPPIMPLPAGSEVAVVVSDQWEVPLDRLLLGDVLGEGAFGVVRRGLLQARSREEQPLLEVAVKMLRDEPSLEERRQFVKEMEMMKSVGQHSNIVSIIGCCTHTSRLRLITEYCAGGDLQSFLRREWDRISCDKAHDSERVKYAQLLLEEEDVAADGNKASLVVNQMYGVEQLTSNDLLSFARQITMGMEYLSSNRVVHRDLAARNVLVCSNRAVKISDFGLSRDVYEQNVYRKISAGKLPVKWMALESLLHQVYTTQSDVWSFGVLLWEIVTLGGNPYPSTETSRVFKLLRSGYRMECPTNCSAELYQIMMSCWQAKPKDRPTFPQLHELFDQLLESSTQEQYLNLDLLSTHTSPHTTTSSLEPPS